MYIESLVLSSSLSSSSLSSSSSSSSSSCLCVQPTTNFALPFGFWNVSWCDDPEIGMLDTLNHDLQSSCRRTCFGTWRIGTSPHVLLVIWFATNSGPCSELRMMAVKVKNGVLGLGFICLFKQVETAERPGDILYPDWHRHMVPTAKLRTICSSSLYILYQLWGCEYDSRFFRAKPFVGD